MSTSPLIQCAINVSEGRRQEAMLAIVRAAEIVPGVTLADWSADFDHNRMVITLLGGPEAIHSGALAISRVAVERIDLRKHKGVHPRLGAVDVIPIVPIRAISMDECARLSADLASDIAAELDLPIYLYERSARAGRGVSLPEIRAGGFEGLFTEPLAGLRRPDYGPDRPHPSAGAVVIGARGPLVAYNVNIEGLDAGGARRIAGRIRAVREVNARLIGVRALGLFLPSRSIAQVSMNLTKPVDTPIPGVFDFVTEEAGKTSVNVLESEVIGLVPRESLGGESSERVLWRGFKETQILDYWEEKL